MEAKGAVREYPKVMKDNEGLLEDLGQTLELIRGQRQLQTDEILSQISKLGKVSQELDSFLQRLGRVRRRSIARQYLRAFKSSRQDDRELTGILNRMDRVKLDLIARIDIIHVGMTARFQEGVLQAAFAAARPVEDKMSSFVQASQPKRQVISSRTFDRAMVIYGDVGVLSPPVQQVSSEYRDCQAWDDSTQVFGGMGSEPFEQLLAQRRKNATPWDRESRRGASARYDIKGSTMMEHG